MKPKYKKKEANECYGVGGMWMNAFPPRKWLAHPHHDWVRTDAVDPSTQGDTLIICQTCCKTQWMQTTAAISALPIQSDETWQNRQHKCGDIHWVRKD
jgi:hypothetical protein